MLARRVEVLVEAARAMGIARWEAFLAPFPELLRDAPLADLRGAARRLRAAFGAKDSIADALPWEACIAMRDGVDGLLRILARAEAAQR